MTDRDDHRPEERGATEDQLGSGPPELGIGLDAEGTAGSGDHDTDTGLDYDFEERRITEDEPAREE